MITYQSIAQQIEKHAQIAKQSHLDQPAREQLIAIKALCDLALQQEIGQPIMKEPIKVNAISEQPMLVQRAVPQQMQSFSSQKLQEDDANGDSIFDF